MKASHNNAAGRVGYVRAVFSKRARGFAVPVDLLRVVCLVAGRVATRQRIADAFRGYLVTESGRVLPMFSGRREWHAHGFDMYCATSNRFPLGMRSWEDYGDLAGGPIDAPELIVAGSFAANFGPNGSFIRRGAA